MNVIWNAIRSMSMDITGDVRRLVILVLVVAAPSVFAQASSSNTASGADASRSVTYRYPPGSIRTEEDADKLLAELANERKMVNARYEEDRRTCAPKFFVNNCMEAAIERRRAGLLKLRSLEQEANLFKRRQRVIERDLALEESKNKSAAKELRAVTTPAVKPSALPEKDGPAQPVSEVPKAIDVNQSGPTKRQIEHNQRVESSKLDDAAKANNRAEKIAAYERKVKASEERQREIAQKKAEKESREKAKASAPDANK